MDVRVGLYRKLSTEELTLSNCGVGKDSWESLGLQRDQTNQSWRKSVLDIHWKDWYWSWNSNTLATWCEKLPHWESPWCWESLKAGEERDDRRWDGWMASLTQWTWVWASSGSWWWTGKPGMLQFMGLQSQAQLSNWTELNWTKTTRILVASDFNPNLRAPPNWKHLKHCVFAIVFFLVIWVNCGHPQLSIRNDKKCKNYNLKLWMSKIVCKAFACIINGSFSLLRVKFSLKRNQHVTLEFH